MWLTSNRLDFEGLFDPNVWNALFEWVSFSQFMFAMVVAVLVGLAIFFLYKLTYRGPVYSFMFNASLISLTVITSVIMMMVSSNLVLSLGALGALSIVRFRTPIKDPADTVYLFWAIGEGIVIGTGLYGVVIMSTLIIGAIVYITSLMKQRQNTYLIVVKVSRAEEDKITNFLFPLGLIRNQTLVGDSAQLDVVIRGYEASQKLYQQLKQMAGVTHLSLIQFEQS